MKHLVDTTFMVDIRSSDHVMMDTPNLDGFKGKYMSKTVGLKVYELPYEFGYTITLIDSDLTVVSCMATASDEHVPEMTTKQDVIIAETLIDSSLGYRHHIILWIT